MIDMKLNIEKLENDYKQFYFNKRKGIELLPFNTSYPNIKDDLKKFDAIVGEIFRIILLKVLPSKYKNKDLSEKDKTIKKILEKIKIEDKNINDFRDILEKILFDEDGNFFIFNKELFLYMNFKSIKVEPLKRISYFISTFFNKELRDKITEKFKNKQNDNLIYELIMDSFSKLEINKENNKINYYLINKDIITLFQEDFLTLLNETEDFFVKNISKLLKYYYFHYVKELILDLDSFFNKPSKIFLSLNWESLSKNRYAYIDGWKKLEPKVQKLFIHTNLLDFLNYLEFENEDKITYKFIANNYEKIDQDLMINSIEEIIKFIKRVEPHNYNLFLLNNKNKYIEEENIIFKKIYEFWYILEFIITEASERKTVPKKYSNYFTEFVKYNFGKNRGQLGFSLSIDKETLLLFTKLIIKNNKKIKIKTLWGEFEKRGLLFDRESRIVIVNFFEELNILEKKSDSGDAQYVRVNK